MIFKDLKKIDQKKWKEWFDVTISKNANQGYGHTRLHGVDGVDLNDLIKQLSPYINKAHQDAKAHFYEEFSIDLDPLSETRYPNALPIKQHKGYFGEVFCGILIKHFSTICANDWSIPAFLFRYHDAAGEYLYRLKKGEKIGKNVPGRTGSDFIAIAIDDPSQEVVSVLGGEAKCHKKWNSTIANEALEKMSTEGSAPVSLQRIGKLLLELHGDEYTHVAQKLRDASLAIGEAPIPRTDLFLFFFESPVTYPPSQIDVKSKPKSHTADRPLQVFEINLKGAEQLIEELYKGMD
ncbi:MAG: hypothetical protein HUU57_15370 [Bdellovibrio sp.]|nr:hypothetical protein [Bdellovibrio sp.]